MTEGYFLWLEMTHKKCQSGLWLSNGRYLALLS